MNVKPCHHVINFQLASIQLIEKNRFLLALMGLFEKRRFRNMLIWACEYDEHDPKTQKGISPEMPMISAFKKFDLDQETINFTGHALALHSTDEYESMS